jgi:pantothenate kinase type III
LVHAANPTYYLSKSRCCTVVATGGLATGFEKYSRHIELVDQNLTLEGLHLIA